MKLDVLTGFKSTAVPFWLYFTAITMAEVITIFLYPLAGIIAYSVILVTIMIQYVFIKDVDSRNLVLALSFCPLVRILSVCMPLGQVQIVYRFPAIYFPLLVCVALVMWVAGLKPTQIGLNFKSWPIQIVIGIISGIAIGTSEYFILGTSPLINNFSFKDVWLPALILIFTTGLVEELMFRGVLQKLAEKMMGITGIIYVSLLFAVLHAGFYSVIDVIFVFLVALIFAAVAKRTGSLLGVILSHGTANVCLFLIAPFVLS